MECIHPEKDCPFREWVCVEGQGCFWNCKWSCPRDVPEECPTADAMWGCPFLCIFEALEEGSGCPYREEVKRQLEEARRRREAH